MVTEIQDCLEKNNQRGKTWKVREGEPLFLYRTCRPDLIHISIKLHEDIPNSNRVTARTIIFEKNQRGIIWKLRMGEQSFMYATCSPDLIHIPINLHEDIQNGN